MFTNSLPRSIADDVSGSDVRAVLNHLHRPIRARFEVPGSRRKSEGIERRWDDSVA